MGGRVWGWGWEELGGGVGGCVWELRVVEVGYTSLTGWSGRISWISRSANTTSDAGARLAAHHLYIMSLVHGTRQPVREKAVTAARSLGSIVAVRICGHSSLTATRASLISRRRLPKTRGRDLVQNVLMQNLRFRLLGVSLETTAPASMSESFMSAAPLTASPSPTSSIHISTRDIPTSRVRT